MVSRAVSVRSLRLTFLFATGAWRREVRRGRCREPPSASTPSCSCTRRRDRACSWSDGTLELKATKDAVVVLHKSSQIEHRPVERNRPGQQHPRVNLRPRHADGPQLWLPYCVRLCCWYGVSLVASPCRGRMRWYTFWSGSVVTKHTHSCGYGGASLHEFAFDGNELIMHAAAPPAPTP